MIFDIEPLLLLIFPIVFNNETPLLLLFPMNLETANPLLPIFPVVLLFKRHFLKKKYFLFFTKKCGPLGRRLAPDRLVSIRMSQTVRHTGPPLLFFFKWFQSL